MINKKLLCFCIVIFLIMTVTSSAGGLFPTLDEIMGIAMPSVGLVIGRVADEHTETSAGVEEIYRNFSAEEYIMFGEYLAGTGAEVSDCNSENNTIIATIFVRNAEMLFSYDWMNKTAIAIYPMGTRAETELGTEKKGDSILPVVGGIMPSAEFAVNRKPDKREKSEDGLTLTWNEFDDVEYEAFSGYLAKTGAMLVNSSINAGILNAEIGLNGFSAYFIYNWNLQIAEIVYPEGTIPESSRWQEPVSSGSVLPKIQDVGRELPRISMALECEPASKETLENGIIQEKYIDFDETDYKVFSQYLKDKGCILINYFSEDDGILVANLTNGTGSFTFIYDDVRHIGTAEYPEHSRVEGDFLLPTNAAEELYKQSFASLEVGDVIRMGSYEQDNNLKNMREPIEWKVIAVNKKQALIISLLGLDGISYGKPMDLTEYEKQGVNWETSYLREWLNGKFYSEAFTDEEKARILKTTVQTKDKTGNFKTNDWVFVLSANEVDKYFKTSAESACRITEYSKNTLRVNNGAVSENGYGMWWLRDMIKIVYKDRNGNFMQNTYNEAAYVYGDTGSKTYKQGIGAPVFCDYLVSVRPVMWIQIDEGPRLTATPEPTPRPTAKPSSNTTNSNKFMSDSDLKELATFYFQLYVGNKNLISMIDISVSGGDRCVALVIYDGGKVCGILMDRKTGEYLGMQR